MRLTYHPTVAKDVFTGHTFDEFLFAKRLGNSISGFFGILRGKKKKTDAMEFIDQMVQEAEVLKQNDSERR
jgi:hypothetical protein